MAVPTAASDQSSSNNHLAPYPEAPTEWLIRLLCPSDSAVSDAFRGSATIAVAAKNTGTRFVGSNINAEFVAVARKRLCAIRPTSAEVRR
jgi:DNA modification methylase